jgi:hypothetical protein
MLRILPILTCSLLTLSLAAADNLLPQSSFAKDVGGMPTGWTVEDWLKPKVSVREEEQQAFVRISTATKGTFLIRFAKDLPAGATALTLTGKVRGSGIVAGDVDWKTARIALQFDGKSTNQQVTQIANGGWTNVTMTGTPPAGAKQVTVSFGTLGGQGDIDVADLVLTAK